MKLRRYQVREEAAIWDVVFQSTRVSNARDYHPELIERWAPHDKDMAQWTQRLADTNPLVAIIAEQIVGMAEIETSGYIDFFYVHPDFQGQGVGKALLAVIETNAKDIAATQLSADVSETAKPFFEFRGFLVTEARSKVVIGHPTPNFAMTKAMTDHGRDSRADGSCHD